MSITPQIFLDCNDHYHPRIFNTLQNDNKSVKQYVLLPNFFISKILYFQQECEIQILKVIYFQGRGISPSHIKHVKYVKRFLVKSADNHITEIVKERKTSEVLRGITVWKWYFVTKIVLIYCENFFCKFFLDHKNNFFSQQVRTILVTKYHDFLLMCSVSILLKTL